MAILCVGETDAPLNAKELDWVFVGSIADRFLYSTFPFITNKLVFYLEHGTKQLKAIFMANKKTIE